MTSRAKRSNPIIISSDYDSLPFLPFDLIPQILSRLPVKLLLRFRCVCKFWNSLISDRKFARVHFNLSTTRNLHCVSYNNPSYKFTLNSYSLQSIFTYTNYNFSQLQFPLNFISKHKSHYVVGSCDGILCLATYYGSINYDDSFVLLWNPSIRKFKELPPFENLGVAREVHIRYGFGYDYVSHNYKLVVLYGPNRYTRGIHANTTKVKIYSLSTDSWRSIQNFLCGDIFDFEPGRYVNGSINWLAFPERNQFRRGPFFIVSFDLGKESYQKIFPPEHGGIDAHMLTLCVLRDCLCIISDYDVWVMKEYGIKESWSKLFNVSCLRNPYIYSRVTNVLYIFEEEQVLLVFEESLEKKLILYNIKNDTFKVNTMVQGSPEVCLESLISPCS